MKIVILFFLVSSLGFGQNLIENGSFEEFTTCPTTLDQLYLATGWSSFANTPDYFNSCAPDSSPLTVPNAGTGYQYPQDGNAYGGFIPYDISGTDYREIIGTQLNTTLQIGTTYYFSFYLNFAGLPDFTSLACNKIGLRFSTIPFSFSNSAAINNFAHYYTTDIITDTSNWIQLKGSYLADSLYNYVSFGNFFDDAHMTSSDTIGLAQNNWQSYYYIDNIRLSTDSNFVFADVNEFDIDKDVSVFPNPCSTSLHISSTSSVSEIELLDVYGNSQLKEKPLVQKSELIINVSGLNAGIYLLKINSQKQSVQKRIIISK